MLLQYFDSIGQENVRAYLCAVICFITVSTYILKNKKSFVSAWV